MINIKTRFNRNQNAKKDLEILIEIIFPVMEEKEY